MLLKNILFLIIFNKYKNKYSKFKYKIYKNDLNFKNCWKPI